jgi:hypothetical protein
MVEREFRHYLVGARDATLLVVEVAVVDIRRAPAAAVGRADQPRIATLFTPGLAKGQRGVEAAVPAAGCEIDCVGEPGARIAATSAVTGRRKVLVMWFPRARTA